MIFAFHLLKTDDYLERDSSDYILLKKNSCSIFSYELSLIKEFDENIAINISLNLLI
jgi:hypothetical protein